MVIDHKSYAVADTEGDHTLIAADNFIEADVILGKNKIEVSLFDCFIFFGTIVDQWHNLGMI